MKKNLLMAIFVMAFSLGASAQFVGGNSNKSNQSFDESYNSFRVSFNPIKIEPDGELKYIDGDFEDIFNFKGFSLEYRRNFNITDALPLYLEAGFGLTYAFSKVHMEEEDEYYDYDYDEWIEVSEIIDFKTKFLSVFIPVNLSCKFSVSDDFIISPYLGLKGRFNLTAKQTISFEEIFSPDYDGDSESEEETFNMFDKKDMDDMWGERNVVKRFQLGWQIGADVEFNNFIVGFAYGSDFGEIMKDCKMTTTTISLGYKF